MVNESAIQSLRNMNATLERLGAQGDVLASPPAI